MILIFDVAGEGIFGLRISLEHCGCLLRNILPRPACIVLTIDYSHLCCFRHNYSYRKFLQSSVSESPSSQSIIFFSIELNLYNIESCIIC